MVLNVHQRWLWSLICLMTVCALAKSSDEDEEEAEYKQALLTDDKEIYSAVAVKFALSDLTQQECNNLLLHRGFYKKSHEQDTVPQTYQTGPYSLQVGSDQKQEQAAPQPHTGDKREL